MTDSGRTRAYCAVCRCLTVACTCVPRAEREHEHTYGWSMRQHLDTGDGTERFSHEHERGDEAHEHVLRDGGVQVKVTTWQSAPASRRPAPGSTSSDAPDTEG